MPRQRSDFTKVVEKIVADYAVLRKQVAKSTAVPFMQEKLSRREALTRMGSMTPQDLTSMTPEERGALVKEVGTGPVLDTIRRQN